MTWTVQGRVLEGMGVFGRVGLVGAELVEVVVVGGFVEGSLVLGGGVLAGGGCKLVGGLHRGFGMEEAGDAGGCDGACSDGGGSGEEAAAGPLLVLEGLLRGDVGGANISVETVGLAEEHG